MERAQSSPRRAGTEQSGISSDDDPVAQSAEQLPFKQWVRGSNPRRVTSSEIPITALFPPRGENCAVMGISSRSDRIRCAGFRPELGGAGRDFWRFG